VNSDSGERPGFQELVERYRHLRGEHRLSGVEGTARRHLERDLAELESRIERRLALWVPEEDERRQWRAHLHHGGPAPSLPAAPAPLVFHGVADDGSIVEVRAQGHKEQRLYVDGAPRGPIPPVPSVLSPEGLRLAGMRCRETFTASPDSLAELRRHVSVGAGELPWEHAPDLLRDGLIDPDFGLTARGRRALTGSRP
jgi:hypothetical protein